MQRPLMVKVNDMQEQMGNVSREMKTLRNNSRDQEHSNRNAEWARP